jgi:hypothetical protein
MRIPLTAVYELVENGWTQARIEELPAVITAGTSPEEAKELLRKRPSARHWSLF